MQNFIYFRCFAKWYWVRVCVTRESLRRRYEYDTSWVEPLSKTHSRFELQVAKENLLVSDLNPKLFHTHKSLLFLINIDFQVSFLFVFLIFWVQGVDFHAFLSFHLTFLAILNYTHFGIFLGLYFINFV